MNNLLKYLVLLAFGTALSSCHLFNCEQDLPGKVENPKLAALINTQLDAEVDLINNPSFYGGLKPNSGETTKSWLKELTKVTMYCACKGSNEKGNRLNYAYALKDGSTYQRETSTRCMYYEGLEQTLYEVHFAQGRVTAVFTDGRERDKPVSYAHADIVAFVKEIVRADWNRNPDRYFPREKTADENRNEWNK